MNVETGIDQGGWQSRSGEESFGDFPVCSAHSGDEDPEALLYAGEVEEVDGHNSFRYSLRYGSSGGITVHGVTIYYDN